MASYHCIIDFKRQYYNVGLCNNVILLVAQWLERWCASLVAKVRFLACPVQSQLLQGENPNDAAATYQVFVNHILMLID